MLLLLLLLLLLLEKTNLPCHMQASRTGCYYASSIHIAHFSAVYPIIGSQEAI